MIISRVEPTGFHGSQSWLLLCSRIVGVARAIGSSRSGDFGHRGLVSTPPYRRQWRHHQPPAAALTEQRRGVCTVESYRSRRQSAKGTSGGQDGKNRQDEGTHKLEQSHDDSSMRSDCDSV